MDVEREHQKARVDDALIGVGRLGDGHRTAVRARLEVLGHRKELADQKHEPLGLIGAQCAERARDDDRAGDPIDAPALE